MFHLAHGWGFGSAPPATGGSPLRLTHCGEPQPGPATAESPITERRLLDSSFPSAMGYKHLNFILMYIQYFRCKNRAKFNKFVSNVLII